MSNLATKIWLFATILALGLGVYIGKKYYSTNTVKEVEVVRKDVQTIIKEIIKPDGTKTIETVIVDKSKENKQSTAIVSATRLPDWAISVQAHSGTDLKPYYGLQVDRRILGPFSITVGLNERSEASLGVKMEF